MAVMMRLKRMGAKKNPFYRIVVIDGKAPRDGRAIEEVGIYDPMKKDNIVTIDRDRVQDWLNKGAVPTLTVKSLLKKEGLAVKHYK